MAQPEQRTGALAALEAAAESGVRVIFANPGTSEMWLVAALDQVCERPRAEGRDANADANAPPPRAVLCLHETVAAGAADGFSRVAHFASSSQLQAPKPPLAAALLHLGPGLANALSALHNARKARVRPPLLTIVGDMATWHQGAGAPLEMRGPSEDLPAIEALAGTVSCAVVRAGEKGLGAGAAVRAAVRAAVAGSDGGVATVVLPHDVSWLPAEEKEEDEEDEEQKDAGDDQTTAAAAAAAEAFASRCAAALGRFPRGSSALLLGGRALLDEPQTSTTTTTTKHLSLLSMCGAISSATGARLLCEPLPARVDRGQGRPQTLERLPYFPDAASRELSRYRCVVLIDCTRPVASFGYDGMRGRLLPEGEDGADGDDEAEGGGSGAAAGKKGPVVFELDGPSDAAVAACVRALCTRVGGDSVVPGVNCGGVFAPRSSSPPPPVASSSSSPLTPASLCAAVAALQPRDCVLVDESLTSGGAHWQASRLSPPFTQLLLTGGAIGAGPPLSLGAAAALRLLREQEERRSAGSAPLRVVINLQADGSLLYSPQALWTQARERLPCVTVVCANRAYAILRLEQAKQRIPLAVAAAAGAGAAAAAKEDDDSAAHGPRPPSEALTALDRPTIDFVALARGMGVPGGACSDTLELERLLKEAIARAEAGKGPFLIQANL
jgi:acetolactate synthase-1/2/3 large subunit